MLKLFVILLSLNYATSEDSLCQSRSLVQTQSVEIKNSLGWQIEAKKSMSAVHCRAEKQIGSEKITIMYTPESFYREHKWYFGIYSEKYQLSPTEDEISAQLFLDSHDEGKKVSILRLEGMKNGKTVPGYIRCEYFTNEISRIKKTKSIKILGKSQGNKTIDIPLPRLTSIIEALEECYKNATHKKPNDFWKGSDSSCG